MARPPKEPHLRMGIDLRIPVTPEQKQAIMDAVTDEPDGFAAWARRVLLEAARIKVGGGGKPIQQPAKTRRSGQKPAK